MKKVLLTILIAGSSTCGYSQFAPNNLVVLQATTGSSGAGAPSVSLVEYDRSNNYVVRSTVNIPSTGTNKVVLVQSGNNTNSYEGLLHLTADRSHLMFVGYDAKPGTTNLNKSNSKTTPRVIVRVDASGAVTYVKSPVMSGAYTRAVAATDANNAWAAGSGTTNTVKYLDLTATQPVMPVDVSPAGELMNIKLFYNRLYVTSNNTVPGKGLYAVHTENGELPKTTASATFQQVIPPLSSGDFTDFVFFDTNSDKEPDLLYIASNNTEVEAENLHKYALEKGVWVARGKAKIPKEIDSPLGARRIRGLIGNKNADGSYTLYASLYNHILKYTDTAGPAQDISATPVIIATSPVNTIFRGLAYTPESTSAVPKTTNTIDSNFHLYYLIGQSNMSGRGVLTPEYTSISHPRVFMLDKNNQWVIAKHPLHFDKSTAGVGLGLSFAIKMAEANPNIKIGLIPCAVGGTSILDWKEGALDTSTGTHPYDDALRRAKFAMQYGIMKGILWQQGEAHRNKPYPAWADDVKVLINTLRAEFNNPQLPFVLGEIGHYLSPVTDINGMISQIVAQVPYTAKVSAEGLNPKSDNLHFDSPSQVIFGERFAEKMLQLQKQAVPVKLGSFDILKHTYGVELKWTVLGEGDSFEVERSSDGNVFVSIGKIKAADQANNHVYSFVDKFPVNGNAYYRIRLVDINGASSYGTPKLLSYQSTVQLYPNPVKQKLTVRHGLEENTRVEISIDNTSGREVAKKKLQWQENN